MQINKELVLSWFEALATGNSSAALGMTHPDFRYFMPGTMPCSGWSDLEAFAELTQALSGLLAGPATMKIGDIVAESDRVFFEAETEAPMKSGETYRNNYLFALRIKDGKIVEMKEFSDVLYVYQTFDVPAFRGPAKKVEGHLSNVTKVLVATNMGVRPQDGSQ